MLGSDIAFWALAATAIVGAVMVVTIRNLFRAALGLILCFLSIAGLFFTLEAEYLGIVQILVYIGAIAVLIIMAIIMTRDVEHSNIPSPYKLPAIIGALSFMGVAIWAILNTIFYHGWSGFSNTMDTHTLGQLIFHSNGLVLAVEIAAVLIMAAVIGAISIAKEK